MSASSNVDIAKQGYAAFGRGDIPGLLALLHADVEWTLPSMENMPWTGTVKGHEGVRGFFSQLAEAIEFESFEPREFIAEGDRVVILGNEKITAKATGKSAEIQWAHVMTFADGKMTRFLEYTDTAKASAILS